MSARGERLHEIAQEFHHTHMDIMCLTETRLQGYHTSNIESMHILATRANSPHQGGVEIAYRKAQTWNLESPQYHGANVISVFLHSGSYHWLLICAYFPPVLGHEEIGEYLIRASNRHSGNKIICGDFNMRWKGPSEREIGITDILTEAGTLINLTDHFTLQHQHLSLHTWTRSDGCISSTCDYMFTSYRRPWRSLQYKIPKWIRTDHKMLVGIIFQATPKVQRKYIQ